MQAGRAWFDAARRAWDLSGTADPRQPGRQQREGEDDEYRE